MSGRPGDSAYTDIVHYELEPYTPAIRAHVRTIGEYGDSGAKWRASRLLWETPDDALAADIESLRTELEAIAGAVEAASAYPEPSPLETVLSGDETLYVETTRTLVRDIHADLQSTVDATAWASRVLSGLLWSIGWEPADLQSTAARLRDFRDGHWIWEK
jgi:hypothetical protein